MDGDSVLNATVFLAYSAYGVLISVARPRRWAETAALLLATIALSAPLLGYDLRVHWSFLEETSMIVCAATLVFALVHYGRSALAEGEYDEPEPGRRT